MKQKRAIIVTLLILSTLFLAGCTKSMDNTMQRTIGPIFNGLAEKIFTGQPMGIIYLRFIIFVIVLSLFHMGLQKIFNHGAAAGGHSHQTSATAIALCLALLSTIAIPTQLLQTIVTTYNVIIGVLFILLPLGLVWLVYQYLPGTTKIERIIRGLVIALVGGSIIYAVRSLQ